MRRSASLVSANMFTPMTMAATAMTPRMEPRKRARMGSVRFALIDDDGVQEQPEADERHEIHQIGHPDHTTGEILVAVEDADTPRHVGKARRRVAQEVDD